MSIVYPYQFKQTIPLRQALINAQSSDKKFFSELLRNISLNQELADRKVKTIIGKGSSAVALETEDGNVLKIVQSNHFPLNRPHENFDVPIYEQGRAGTLYYYIEQKLYQHGLSDGFVKEVKEMIAQKGYVTTDLEDSDIHQIGISEDGELFLLDPECAKYKNLFQAVCKKVWKILKKF